MSAITFGLTNCEVCHCEFKKKAAIHHVCSSCKDSELYKIRSKWLSSQVRAEKINVEHSISLDKWIEIISNPCLFCGDSPTQTEIIICRLDAASGWIDTNCLPACYPCTRMKFNLSIDSFIGQIIKIYKHNIG